MLNGTEAKITLHNYWRSSCSWRVRIALEHKKMPYLYKAVNLLKAEDTAPDYYNINPAGVPTLEDNGFLLGQSLAIIEYLEEKYPTEPALLPPLSSPQDRAMVRVLCQQLSAVQTLQNLGVQQRVGEMFGAEHKAPWAKGVIEEGLDGVEVLLKKTAGKFCYGDSFTIADCCLVPQLYASRRFGADLSKFPTIFRLAETLEQLDVVKNSHPDNMPDAVK